MKTVSLKLSKELKEVGFPQETEFYWRVPDDGKKSTVESREKMKKFYYIFPTYASPTADEILDELPYTIKKDDQWYSLTLEFEEDTNHGYKGVTAGYRNHAGEWLMGSGTDNLLRSLSDVYLYLKKEGLI